MSGIDRAALARVRAREDAAFAARTLRSAALVARAEYHLPNGVPMAWMRSLYDHPPVFATGGNTQVMRTACALTDALLSEVVA